MPNTFGVVDTSAQIDATKRLHKIAQPESYVAVEILTSNFYPMKNKTMNTMIIKIRTGKVN